MINCSYNLKQITLLTLLLSWSGFVSGQVIRIPGDTTGRNAKKDSVIYGPKTTKFIYEQDLKYNRLNYQIIDTTLTGVHNFTRVEQLGNGLQYLGTIGSASTPIYPKPPQVIGATSGFNAYNMYEPSPADIKYYDARSPYTNLIATFGGQGRSAVDLTFTRNITANWNVGTNISTLSIDRQIGGRGVRQGDKYARSYYFNLFSYYRTKNKKYHLMGVLSRLNHRVQESGGIIESIDEVGLTEFYAYNDAIVWLTSASDREYRFRYHLYHQYAVNDLLQVYHEFNLYHQHDYFFYETSGKITNDYFKRIYLDSTRTADLTKFKLLENEVGFKGNLAALFYNVHVKLRNPRIEYPSDTLLRDTLGIRNNELYGGFDLRLDLGEKTYLRGGAEYLNTNAYVLEAAFNNPILKASYVRTRALPSYLSQRYLGNHNRWENNFGSVAYDQLSGSLEYQFKWFYLRPFMTATNITNPIYYRRDTVNNQVSRQAFPVQAGGAAQVLSPGVAFRLDFLKKMHLDTRVTYSLVSGRASEAVPLPSWYLFSRLYFANRYIENKIGIQLGLDMQLTSAYLGYDYDVATQQFFVQRQMFGTSSRTLPDNFWLPHPNYSAYFVADLFFVMQVRRAHLYVKIPQINQGIPEDGYFATPFYTGQPRVYVDIGINWMFFN